MVKLFRPFVRRDGQPAAGTALDLLNRSSRLNASAHALDFPDHARKHRAVPSPHIAHPLFPAGILVPRRIKAKNRGPDESRRSFLAAGAQLALEQRAPHLLEITLAENANEPVRYGNLF